MRGQVAPMVSSPRVRIGRSALSTMSIWSRTYGTAPSVVELVMWSTFPPGRRARKRFAHRAASDVQTACQPVDYSCSDGMTHEVVEHREMSVPAV
jgi:hypothetical protein